MKLEKTRKATRKNSKIGFELILIGLQVILTGLDRQNDRNGII